MDSSVGPDARIALSSTYRVVGDSVMLPSVVRVLSSGVLPMHVLVLWWTSPIMGDVKYAARIRDTHEPFGTPVSINQRSSLLPSRQMATHHPCRKEWIHFVIGSGRQYVQIVLSRCEWGIESKKPVMLILMPYAYACGSRPF